MIRSSRSLMAAALICSSFILVSNAFAISEVAIGDKTRCIANDPAVEDMGSDMMSAAAGSDPCTGTWCALPDSDGFRKPICGCSYSDGGSCTTDGTGSSTTKTCKSKDGKSKTVCKRNSNGQGCECTTTTT